MEKLLTVPQVCAFLQVKRGLIYKWVHYGFVPHIKLGRSVRFKQSDLEKWVNEKVKKGRKGYKLPPQKLLARESSLNLVPK